MSVGETSGTQRTRSRLALALLPVVVFAALAAVFALSLRDGDPSRVPSVLIDRPVPAFELPAVEALVDKGEPIPGVTAADLKQGRVSIVNIWASWCGPCRIEHPFLMRLAERGDLQMVGINYKDQAENARRFLGTHGNPFQRVGADAAGRTAVDWGVYGVPETFVVDGAGIVRYKHVGPISEQTLSDKILPVIAEALAR